MTTLPEDILEYLLKLSESGGPFRDEAKRLLDKYVPPAPVRTFNGTPNETWAIPPELVRDR